MIEVRSTIGAFTVDTTTRTTDRPDVIKGDSNYPPRAVAGITPPSSQVDQTVDYAVQHYLDLLRRLAD